MQFLLKALNPQIGLYKKNYNLQLGLVGLDHLNHPQFPGHHFPFSVWKRELTSLSGSPALSSSTRLPPSLLFQVETLNEIGKSIITERKLILMVSMTSSPCFLDKYSYNWIHFHISIFLCLGTVMAITLTRLFLVFQVP